MRLAFGVALLAAMGGTAPQGGQDRPATATVSRMSRQTRPSDGYDRHNSHDNDEFMENIRGNFTFLALGDSYTIGEKVDSAARWPVQLVGTLRGAGLAVDDPRIIARTGWTTDELSAGIDKAGVTGTYSLVSLLIGVNNQYRGRPLEEYRTQFRALLDRAIGYAGGDAARVIVLSIPDWGVMPFAEGRDRAKIAREIDQFNATARAEVDHSGAQWVDITPVSRQQHADWAASDGLHPSGAQYAAWAAMAFAPARLVLTAP